MLNPYAQILARAARLWPTASAVWSNGVDTSFAELHSQVTALGTWLRTRIKLEPGDRVADFRYNSLFSIVTDFGGNFDATFTLPEFATYAMTGGDRPTGLAYLRADIPEVEDPTGRTHGVWQSVWRELDGWCQTTAGALRHR